MSEYLLISYLKLSLLLTVNSISQMKFMLDTNGPALTTYLNDFFIINYAR